MLTQNLLKEFLHYDEDTGMFTWKAKTSKFSHVNIGSSAGSINSCGYIHIKLFSKNYKAHQLVWLYVYGVFPSKVIDHINGITYDNRIINLREVTQSENCMNKRKMKNNTSGYTGVSWHKGIKKWTVQININKKQIHLGCFDNLEEAAAVYKSASEKYHGVFARIA